MKTFYFIINYFMTLFTTLVFNTQVPELHLKPVRIKVEERPHDRGMRTEE